GAGAGLGGGVVGGADGSDRQHGGERGDEDGFCLHCSFHCWYSPWSNKRLIVLIVPSYRPSGTVSVSCVILHYVALGISSSMGLWGNISLVPASFTTP